MTAKQLILALEIAQQYNISSLKQLAMFIEVASSKHPTKTVLDLSKADDAYSAEYRRALGTFIKLSIGASDRNRNGLKLLRYAEEGRNKRVSLTTKGESLRMELQQIGLKI